jgi:hypothetical protein
MGTNPDMVRVAVATLRCCNPADRTAAIVTAIEELPVDLVKIVAVALDKGKPGQFSALFEAYERGTTREIVK